VYAIAETVKRDFGQVDLLVNNAGIATGKSLLTTPDERIVKVFEVNAIAHFWTLKAFLPGMMDRNHGHIVTIASAAGTCGVAGLVDYCSTKFAAVGTSESLHQECRKQGKDGVHTLCVCPYYIHTGMFEGVRTYSPFLPILDPNYVADKIINAIKNKDSLLCLPRFVYVSRAVRTLLPTSFFDPLSDAMGINKTMDEFVQTR